MPRKLICVGHGAANLDFPAEGGLSAPTPTATAGDGEVDVSWGSATGGTGPLLVQLQRSTTSGSGFTSIDGATSSPYTDTDVTNDQEYFYRTLVTDLGSGDTVVSDSFTAASDTELSSHTGETGAGWTKHPEYGQDLFVDSDGYLRGASTNSDSAAYYASGVPASADYSVSTTVQHLNADNNRLGILIRCDTTADTFYMVRWSESDTQWQLWKLVAGTATNLDFTEEPAPSGADREVVMFARGDEVVVFVAGTRLFTVTDTDISAAGRAGVRAFNSDGSVQGQVLLSLDALENHDTATSAEDSATPVAGSLQAGTITVTPSDQQNGLTATEPTGGTSPYTYQWYGSMTQGFTPGAGNELSGFTSLSETHTGLTNEDTWYYRLIATDDASDSVTYDEASGTPSDVTPVFEDDFSSGDTSKTGGGFSWNSGNTVIEYETGKFALEFKHNPASTRQLAAAASASDTEIVVGSEPRRYARFVLDPGGANEETHYVLGAANSNITDNGDGTWTVTLGDASNNATTLANSHSNGADYQYNADSHPAGQTHRELRFAAPPQQEVFFEFDLYVPDGTESWGGHEYTHRDGESSDNNKFWYLWSDDYSAYGTKFGLESNPTGSPGISKARPVWGTNSAEGGRAVSNWGDLGNEEFIDEVDLGTWMNLRFQLRVSDNGSSNGIWRGWKNGTLVIEDTGLANDPVDGVRNEIDNGYLQGWWNSAPEEETRMLFTNFKYYDTDPGW